MLIYWGLQHGLANLQGDKTKEMIHIDLQKWPHPNEEADFRISETILLIGVYSTDWRIYRMAELKNRKY